MGDRVQRSQEGPQGGPSRLKFQIVAKIFERLKQFVRRSGTVLVDLCAAFC